PPPPSPPSLHDALPIFGPRSAGADPGPACYARGGDEATITDAAVVLGWIDPDYFLGGRLPLDAGAAGAVIERTLAAPLGLDVYRSEEHTSELQSRVDLV